jgi:hypothetical protein
VHENLNRIKNQMNTCKHQDPTRSISQFQAFVVALAFTLVSSASLASTAPALGTTSTYGIVSSTFTNTANPTIITGSVCYTTAPVLAPTTITGATLIPCPVATGADQGSALANVNGQACISLGVGAVALNTVNLGSGLGVFTPGCYSSGGAMSVAAGAVTLNGPGVYIFRSTGTLTTAAGTSVAVAGGACANDVFWAPNGATTLGANTSFVGNILDGVANAVTIGTTSTLIGRILSYGGVVTTNADTITVPSCAPFGSGSATIPTLSEWGLILLSGLVAVMSFVMMRRRNGAAF